MSMKYFYGICIALVLGLSAKMLILEENRVPGAPVAKMITALPVLGQEQGCNKEWFKHPLASSMLAPDTNELTCTYHGKILKSECEVARLTATYMPTIQSSSGDVPVIATAADGHWECRQQAGTKLLKRIGIVKLAEETYVVAPTEEPPVDCEKTWGGARFEMLKTNSPTKICVYSGGISEEQCIKTADARVIGEECRQQIAKGNWKIAAIKRKDGAITCDLVWMGQALLTPPDKESAFKKCQYSGVVERAECEKTNGAIISIVAPDIIQCVLPAPDKQGAQKIVGIRS